MENSFVENFDILQKSINFWFKNQGLLQQAMTHKSFHNESEDSSLGHNERLEFLGDSVIDLVLGKLLMDYFPNDPEGKLSKKRASLVNESALFDLAKELKIQDCLRLGRGEIKTGGAQKPRLLASAFEALVGAMYLDAGFEATYGSLKSIFEGDIESIGSQIDFEMDYKTRLQEICQKSHRVTPSYVVDREEGPPHDRIFYVSIYLQTDLVGQGNGKSKKQAEQNAAKNAIEIFEGESV